ncbi:3-hydroxyacyl-CoA dehydrogenase [Tepidimonas charontis]|uniref:3-hydroxyadipyl-CoA dehydrogenase n=1 Tax=Tepidimonas charontis TaxID=2267262 RepID=A0A554XJ75_9BURK|nr:3-hydroxyacyl-CoA dehydrogenase [Tepidimonas charontis]TSE35887.1 3-hydroxyadipyl-CoA dehydrogenase [Tepidimonas charontis]
MTEASAVLSFCNIGVVGTGAMGRGIAQIAAQAGATVSLMDAKPEALEAAQQALAQTWQRLVDKGRLAPTEAAACMARLRPVRGLTDLAACDLVIEAIVERLDAKQALFEQLESIVAPTTVLATNTSSLSVTAIGSRLRTPQRLAGFHFFNPVPLMKVVEVVSGLKTDPEVVQRLCDLARQMGHTPVRAQDTPGFIVNHAGRGYITEALRIAGECVADFATIDRILKDQGSFRLGPFELLDLTALDVSQPVMESIYHQYYEEPRFRPSVIAAQRLAGGVVGRKVGEGFYRYVDGQAQVPPEPPVPDVAALPPVWVPARAARRTELLQLLAGLGASIETTAQPSPQALIVVAPLGHDVTTVAAVERLDPGRTVGIDMLLPDAAVKRRVIATNPATRSDMRAAAHALFARDGKPVSVIRDSGGFVTQRVLATIVNIAADICQQGICTPADLETAVTLGLGYPAGPLAMGDRVGAASVLEILFNLQTVYGDMRYRPSPWLRRRGALGLSLTHPEE